jgi:hypothetical protein
MKKRTKIRKNIVIGLTILLTTLPVSAQVEFTGDLSIVSTYVWRGLKANNGPALQSTAAGSYGIFTLGFWGSSVNFGDDVEVETDVFAELALPTGDLTSSIGATLFICLILERSTTMLMQNWNYMPVLAMTHLDWAFIMYQNRTARNQIRIDQITGWNYLANQKWLVFI